MNKLIIKKQFLPIYQVKSYLNSYAASKRGDFFQIKPEITNQFLEDPFMIKQLQLEIPQEVHTFIAIAEIIRKQ